MNIILTKKISEIDEFSNYFKRVSIKNNWKYLFEVLFYFDNFLDRRGIGKKTKELLETFFTINIISVQDELKELEIKLNTVYEYEIKYFSKIINSDGFKKLDEFVLNLHKQGFSNRKIFLGLKDEKIGLFYKIGANSMNTLVFLETFEKASKKNKGLILVYLNKIKSLFQEAYREEVLKK